ncbi:hypothetical protein [Teichococcus vastitatis]|uniref:Uncharacterized protein n=1 Tax=Teichococcus vastitatis TaxID=2307076 RepID=A0ABS9W858_9PROT|nr:hypothetical protein [Pseudoroseomonas vastitatis]MCI0755472.1 hypothetical protein [Pseudoroseomonas vastitatis]
MSNTSQSHTQIPEQIGIAGASRTRERPGQEFQQCLEQRLDCLRAILLQQGHPAPAAVAICQAAREAAQEVRQ